jgi:hypothetical protein
VGRATCPVNFICGLHLISAIGVFAARLGISPNAAAPHTMWCEIRAQRRQRLNGWRAMAGPVVARESPSCRDCSCRQVASINSACGPLGFDRKGFFSVNGENAPSQQIVPRVVAYLSILLGITSRRMRSICGRRGGPLYPRSLIHAAASSPSLFIMRARNALAEAKPALKPSPVPPEPRLATDLLQGLCANLPNVETAARSRRRNLDCGPSRLSDWVET